MHSVTIAEWFLTLVTTRDRAATTVGDLTERAAARGGVWFWSAVFRTVASLLWRDGVEHPARITGLACVGLAIYIGIDLLVAALSGAAFYGAVMAAGYPLHLDSIGWKLWFTLPALVSSLVIGRMLARWAPGRELAACLLYAILASVYNLVPALGGNGVFTALLCVLVATAAAAWGRRLRLRALV
jgi:hypothetical protein